MSDCTDHEHLLTLCWRCVTDEIWNPAATRNCQECDGPPPDTADQCEGHGGEPCWCGVPIDEPCDNGAHLAAEVQRYHDIAMGM